MNVFFYSPVHIGHALTETAWIFSWTLIKSLHSQSNPVRRYEQFYVLFVMSVMKLYMLQHVGHEIEYFRGCMSMFFLLFPGCTSKILEISKHRSLFIHHILRESRNTITELSKTSESWPKVSNVPESMTDIRKILNSWQAFRNMTKSMTSFFERTSDS